VSQVFFLAAFDSEGLDDIRQKCFHRRHQKDGRDRGRNDGRQRRSDDGYETDER
jgi:hypothetical protein